MVPVEKPVVKYETHGLGSFLGFMANTAVVLDTPAAPPSEEAADLRPHGEIEMYLGLPDVPMGTNPLKW